MAEIVLLPLNPQDELGDYILNTQTNSVLQFLLPKPKLFAKTEVHFAETDGHHADAHEK